MIRGAMVDELKDEWIDGEFLELETGLLPHRYHLGRLIR